MARAVAVRTEKDKDRMAGTETDVFVEPGPVRPAISRKRNTVILREARAILERRGYRFIRIVSRMKGGVPVSLVGIREPGEVLHVCIKFSPERIEARARLLEFCSSEIQLFRKLVRKNPGKEFVRFEIWAAMPGSKFGCIGIGEKAVTFDRYWSDPEKQETGGDGA